MKSLFLQVYLVFLVLFFSAFFLVYLFTQLALRSVITQEINSSLSVMWQSVASLVQEEDFQYDEEIMVNFRRGTGSFLKVLKDGKPIELQPDKSVLNFPSKYGLFLFEINGRQFAGYGNNYGNYYIVVYKDITDKKALSEEFSKKFVIGWLTLLFLYTLIAYPLWRFSFRVVRKLAQRIKESNPAKLEGLDERVPSELKPIVESYNRLVERLSTYINTQKFFFYHLSHELKTPLSIIRTSADLALSRQRRPLEMRELLLSIRDAVDRATQTLEKLLLLYRLEAQNVIPKKEKLELRALVMDVLKEFKQLIESKNLNVEVFQDNFEVEGDYELVHSLFSNLIENAIKYSFPNGTIRVHKRDTCLVIEDEGVGIPEEDLKKVFEPFFRSEQAKQEEGLGLGLSISRAIVNIMGWHIHIHSSPNKGTSVKVCVKNF